MKKLFHPKKGVIEETGMRMSPIKGPIKVGVDILGRKHDLDGSEIPVDSMIERRQEMINDEETFKDQAVKEEYEGLKQKFFDEEEKFQEKDSKRMDKEEHHQKMREQAEQISTPIVEAIKEIPETIIPEFPDHYEEQSVWQEKVLEVLQKELPEDDYSSIVDAIREIKIPEIKIPEPKDYSKLLGEIKKALPKDTDLTGVIKAIAEIPQFEIPQELIQDGRLKVAVDKIGLGGGGGSVDTSALATEETLLAVKNAIETGGGLVNELFIPADSYTLSNGSLISGTLDNAKYHDETYLVLAEVASDGLSADFTFNIGTNKLPKGAIFHGRYEGSAAHYINFWAWDYLLADWIHISGENEDITNNPTDIERVVSLTGNSNFVKADGEVKIRLKHSIATYNNSHRLYIDYLQVSYYQNATGLAIKEYQNPLAAYQSAGMDMSAVPMYFGFLNLEGLWYIKKFDPAVGTLYFKGDTDYPTNWTNRASLSYDLYNLVF